MSVPVQLLGDVAQVTQGQRVRQVVVLVVARLQLPVQLLLQLRLYVGVQVVEDVAVAVGGTTLLDEPLEGHGVEDSVHELVLCQSMVAYNIWSRFQ